MRGAWLIPLAALAVCCAKGVTDEDDSSDDTGPGGNGSGAGTAGVCSGTTFADGQVGWGLPSYGLDYGGDNILTAPLGEATCPDSGVLRFATLDLTGDDKPDLVITRNCDDDPDTGQSRWWVHENTGTGFAAEPLAWPLPAYGLDASLEPLLGTLGGAATCPSTSASTFVHAITDLTGDGKPDLVVTASCDDATTGHTRWLVHENTGTGFAATPTEWTLPDYGTDYYGDGLLGALNGSSSCESTGVLVHGLMDLTGDLKPDLVVTANCGTDAQAGVSHWLVHTNSGSGFATTAAQWTLPTYGLDAYGEPLFDSLGGGESCPSAGYFTFAVVEMTGDDQPDLVITDNCYEDAETGLSRWLLHENSGSGFAVDAADWALPDYGLDANSEPVLAAMAGRATCTTSGTTTFATLDLTGDGKPDLVVARNCNDDAETGLTRWLVHSNTGNGFDPSSQDWPLPTYGLDNSGDYVLDSTSDGVSCASSGTIRFSLFDLDGDARPDLVLTANCDDDVKTGASRWLLHRNECEIADPSRSEI